jgi:hypothetical protein
MKGIALDNCEVGTVSSMKDGSVKFTVYSAELRPSERGVVMEFHGKACAVVIKPHDTAPEEIVKVDTERTVKTPSSRLRAVLFVFWQQQNPTDEWGRRAAHGTFEEFYAKRIEELINGVKEQLNP